VHHCRDRGHVDPQTRRSSSGGWRRLLLESPVGLLVYGCSLHPSVAREHAPVRARPSVLRHWGRRTKSETKAVARMAPTAHRWHGDLVHPPSHGLPCGQRTTFTSVAFASAPCALASAQPRRPSSSSLGAETSPSHSSLPRASSISPVKTDETANAFDVRGRVHYGGIVLRGGQDATGRPSF
jgi:hypothetical protein